MYTEEYQHNGIFFRKLLLKLLLIGAIIFLLIWILPKFMSYKPSNKTKQEELTIEEKNKKGNTLEENLLKLKNAALLYYKEEHLPTENGKYTIVTLKELENEKLITKLTDSQGKACDNKKSYAKLTKLEDDYLLKVYIECTDKEDYLLVHVGKYKNCTNTICEKSNIIGETEEVESEKEEQREEKKTNNNQEEFVNSPISSTPGSSSASQVLSNFTAWSNDTKTSCETQEVICASNDFSCLQEVRVKRKTETTQIEKEYHPLHLVLYKNGSTQTNACKNYNYVIIQNQLYITTGNYEEILSLNNKRSTENWLYKGTISTKTTPSFGANEYYKFAGADFRNCGDTCTEEPSYYYDVYEYIKPITKAVSTTENCSATEFKNINNYKVVKQRETIKRKETVTTTVCYQSIRTRKIINK